MKKLIVGLLVLSASAVAGSIILKIKKDSEKQEKEQNLNIEIEN